MPLKLKRRAGVWYVRGTVAGQGCYESTGTAERGRAEAYRAKREKELWDRSVFGERATVTFGEAVESYLRYNPLARNDRAHVDKLLTHFDGVALRKIDQRAVDLAIGRLHPTSAPATVIRSLITPLTAILTHAAARQWCDRPRFQRPTQPKTATAFLTPAEALALLDAAADHLRPLLHFLLCTGARLSEALDLEWADVHLADRLVVLRDTKNGRDRRAALPEAAMIALANLPDRTGHVFRRQDGQPYADRERQSGGQISTAWRTACERAGLVTGIDPGATLPANRLHGPRSTLSYRLGLSPHDLRHTWATWFYAASKDLLLLKVEGDWSSVSMVERYAHLMRSEDAADVALVWGASHPRIGPLIRAQSVQPMGRLA